MRTLLAVTDCAMWAWSSSVLVIVKSSGSRTEYFESVLVTGAVTLQTRNRLKEIYDQMSSPKFVIAVGTCACSGGIFDGCYCVTGGTDTVIPVDAYLPGCAVRPEAIIDAVDKLLKTIQPKNTKKKPSKKEAAGHDGAGSHE